jgi:DME family drug/metabolite transporter
MARHRILVLASAVCFGTTGTAQALGADGVSPVVVGAARVLVGAVGLVLVTLLVGSGDGGLRGRVAELLRLLGAAPHRGPVWRAGLAVATYQLSFFLAVRTTGVAVGTVVALGSAPVVTGALAWLVHGVRPGRRWAVATVLAGCGLVLLVLGGASARVAPAGVALALAAAASYAAYTLTAKRLLDAGVRSESLMAAVFSSGAGWLLPALALAPVGALATGAGVAAVLWLGLVTTTLAYVLFARGLRRLSAAETSTLVLAEPLTAAALGVVLLRERVGATSVVGAGLLLGGLAVVALPRRGGDRAAAAVAGTGTARAVDGAP